MKLILLFDFDGTLVELNKLKAYETVAEKYSLSRDTALAENLRKLDSELCMIGEYDRREVFKKYASELGNTDVEELCRVFWEEITRTQNVKPGCPETLKILKDEGYILACVTDSDGFGGNKLRRIEATGLKPYFDNNIFIGGDNERPRKGSTEYLEWVVRELAPHSARWVMIGDKTEVDLAPAKAIGMETVLVKNDEYPGDWQREVKSLHELLPIIHGLKPAGQTTTQS